MEEKKSRSNYIFTLGKLILFLIISCFLVKLSAVFWKEVRNQDGFNMTLLGFSALMLFCCYNFLADLNNVYKTIQRFFFRNTYITYMFSSALLLLGVAYLFLPKIFNKPFNRDIFIFLGGFVFTGHLVYIAREIKGNTFTALVNYLFIFSVFYIFNLLLLSLYLKIGFPIHLGSIVIDSAKGGISLMQSIFAQFTG